MDGVGESCASVKRFAPHFRRRPCAKALAMTFSCVRRAGLMAMYLGACAAKPAPPGQAPKQTSARATAPVAASATVAPPATKATLPPGAARMQEPGDEARALAQLAGRWDVVATFRASPQAQPIVSKGLIADREMIGLYLQEVMKPAPGSTLPDFRRTSFLTYSRLEGRWQFVSIDTRMPVGIMPAYSFGKESAAKLTLTFESLAFVGMGAAVEGRMVRSNYVITRDSTNHDLAQQYWVQADGSETQWLAVEYAYTRQTAK